MPDRLTDIQTAIAQLRALNMPVPPELQREYETLTVQTNTIAHNSGAGAIAASGGVAAANQGVAVGGNVDQLHIHNPPQSSNPPFLHSSIPHQPTFFGRTKELATIADAIAPEARTWGALIDGPGGIGKTALAIRAAHCAPAEHFTHKIFLSAKVRELTPQGEEKLEDFMLPNYIALLTELARELKEEGIAKLPENERANAVRRALGDKRALLVIDNLETFPDAERLRLFQFLGRLPAGCKAIVTSRRRTDLDVRTVRLDRLEQADALALLDDLATRNRYLRAATSAERQTLYEITNGNPLLMRWTAGQLGRRGSACATVPEACEYLKHAPRDNDPLEYIFGDLLDTFTASETAVLAALTHFTQPAKTKWVAELADLAEPQAQTALEDLADRALLVSDSEAQTFLLPLLAAQFLRAKRPDIVVQMSNRLIKRALAIAAKSSKSLNLSNVLDRFRNLLQGQNAQSNPIESLEAGWPTISAALPLLVNGDNARLQPFCDEIIEFLNFSGHWDEWLWLSEQAEEKARASKDFDNAGWRAFHAGMVYYLRGQSVPVLTCADRAAAHWEQANAGAREKSMAIRLRGLGYGLNKDYPSAIAAYQQSLALRRTLSTESEDFSVALNDLAGAEQLSGDYTAAERHYAEALRIAKKTNDREGVTLYIGNLAGLALNREDWPTTERLAREALPLAEAIGRQELVASNCGRIAKALARQGQPHAGLPYARRAVEIYTKLRIDPETMEKAQAVLRECEGG